MKLSLIKYPVAGGGGSTPPAGSSFEVQFNNGGVFGASPSLVFNPTGFASLFPSLIVSESNLPSIQILTSVEDTNSNGPVLFFGNTLTEGLIWQFFMPALAKGFGAFNRNVFDYAYYCTFDTNNTIIGGTTGTPPPDDGNKLQVNGTARLIVQDFVDNATAIAGGLVVGTIYRNGDILQIVH